MSIYVRLTRARSHNPTLHSITTNLTSNRRKTARKIWILSTMHCVTSNLWNSDANHTQTTTVSHSLFTRSVYSTLLYALYSRVSQSDGIREQNLRWLSHNAYIFVKNKQSHTRPMNGTQSHTLSHSTTKMKSNAVSQDTNDANNALSIKCMSIHSQK